ncbi:hypothetical protein FRB90_005164 [Tulasnella sp. 427]|nr:hypothetical protein FRB90_005164 [Tulasnella sp. 427]
MYPSPHIAWQESPIIPEDISPSTPLWFYDYEAPLYVQNLSVSRFMSPPRGGWITFSIHNGHTLYDIRLPNEGSIEPDVTTSTPFGQVARYTRIGWGSLRMILNTVGTTEVRLICLNNRSKMATLRAFAGLHALDSATPPFDFERAPDIPFVSPEPTVTHAKAATTTGDVQLTLPGLAHEVTTPETPYYDAASFLSDSFDTQVSLRRAVYAADAWVTGYMKRMKGVHLGAHEQKPFMNRFSLWHSDFEPRKILARKLESGKFAIEAVLDFDGAVSAPIEIAWTLRHWLWTRDAELRDSDMDWQTRLQMTMSIGGSKNLLKQRWRGRSPALWRSGGRGRLGSEEGFSLEEEDTEEEDSGSSDGDADSVAASDG